jgi:hypothetical protein
MAVAGVLGYRPDALEVFLFVLALVLFLAATGVIPRIPIGKLEVKAPARKSSKTLVFVLAAGLVVASVLMTLGKPTWRRAITRELVYSGLGLDAPKQVVVDGERQYILSAQGHIFEVLRGDVQLRDSGTHSKQVVAAGGLIYVLKDDGKIWLILAFRSGTEGAFHQIDSGSNTRMIAVAGETVYVLKNTGVVNRIAVGLESSGAPQREFTRLPGVENTRQMVSSGGMLLWNDAAGSVRAYLAAPEVGAAPGRTILDEYNERLRDCGRADAIAVDGGTVYFIGLDRRVYACREGVAEVVFASASARTLDVSGGTVYVVTTGDELWRIDVVSRSEVRYLAAPDLPDAELEQVVASAYGCFVIDSRGRVWRYSETLRRQ